MIGSLLLAAAGLALLPASSVTGRRLAWLAARRWPGGITAQPAAKVRLHRLGSLARRPIVTTSASGGIAGLLAGPVPGLLAGTAAMVLGHCWQRLRVERSLVAETAALSQAVAALVAEHAAGATLGSALLAAAPAAGPHQPALQRAGRLASLGQQPVGALIGEPALARIAVATALVSRSGVTIGEVLARVRGDLQAEQRVRAAVAESVAGPRSSALLLSGLPIAGLAMGVALGASPQRVLLHTVAGLVALAVGVVLNLTGLWWTVRLTGLSPPPAPSRASPLGKR
jgi:tight adherence protein B